MIRKKKKFFFNSGKHKATGTICIFLSSFNMSKIDSVTPVTTCNIGGRHSVSQSVSQVFMIKCCYFFFLLLLKMGLIFSATLFLYGRWSVDIAQLGCQTERVELESVVAARRLPDPSQEQQKAEEQLEGEGQAEGAEEARGSGKKREREELKIDFS